MTDNCEQPNRDCPFDERRVEQLTRIETNQTTQIQQMDRLIEHVEKQNGRIGKLENWKWYLAGAIGAIILWLRYGGKT